MSLLSTSATVSSIIIFCDESVNKVYEFEKIEEFERPLIWWSCSDYARFRSMCNKTVKALRTNNVEGPASQAQQDNDNFYCLRGLENWGNKECQERRARIQKAVWLVIDGQRALFDEGVVDGFACADIYQQHTADMRIQAHVRGLQDEEEEELWNRIEEDREEDEICASSEPLTSCEAIEKKLAMPNFRVKRRRSSDDKNKKSIILFSLKNFARKITLSSAA